MVPSRPTALVSNSRAFCPIPSSLGVAPRRAFQASLWCGFPVPLGTARPAPALLPGHGPFQKCRQDFPSLDDITKFSMPVFPDQCGCAGKRAVAVQCVKRCPSQGSCARAIPGADTRRDACLRLPDRELPALPVPEQHLAPRQGLGVPEPPRPCRALHFDPLRSGSVIAARLPGQAPWPLCHCSVTAPGSDGEDFPGPG